MKEKNYLVFFMQTIGIILVVLGHSFYQNMFSLPVFWIYSFHMPLFFFLSGYLLHYTTKGNIQDVKLSGKKGFVFKKAYRLLLPYVVISSLMFIPKILLSSFTVRNIDASWNGYFDMLLRPYHNVIGSYWFLPTLFLIYIVAILTLKLKNSICKDQQINELIVLLPLIILHFLFSINKDSLLNINGVFHFIIFFAIGYETERLQIERKIKPYSAWIAPITTVVSVLFLLFEYQTLKQLTLLTSINGILMVISWGQLYEKYRLRFLNHLYGTTYMIYLFSFFPQFILNQLLLHYISIPYQISIFLSFITGIYIPYFIYNWMKKYPDNIFSKLLSLMTGHASL